MIPGIIAAGVFDVGKALIDKLIPDPEARAKAQLELVRLDAEGRLDELHTRMGGIMAEAQSDDPWTSRARPSFLYVFYAIITFMVMAAPVVGVFFPEKMDLFFHNVGKGFDAIPEELWWTFTAGYLGYMGNDTFKRVKGIK